jgi:hypothetical protein
MGLHSPVFFGTGSKFFACVGQAYQRMATPQVFTLNHAGMCSGMFWRPAPSGMPHEHSLPTGAQPDWPRNGAVLRGVVHTLDDAFDGSLRWLEVLGFRQQNRAGDFHPTPNCWMPFEQNGLLLHK